MYNKQITSLTIKWKNFCSRAVEFTSLQKNQQLPQKTSHNIVKRRICSEDQPCTSLKNHARALIVVSETEERWVSQPSRHSIQCSHSIPDHSNILPPRSMPQQELWDCSVELFNFSGHWFNANSWALYIPHEICRSNHWRVFADGLLQHNDRNAQQSFPTLLVVTNVRSTHISPNSWIPYGL